MLVLERPRQMLNVGQAERPFGVAAASGSVTPVDPYFANVVLLAGNESGADGTTTFLDQSSYARTLTAVGNAQWDTAQAPTGQTSSILLDGTGDSVEAADSDDWHFAAGDFTLEFSLRFNVNAKQCFMLTQDSGGAGGRSWGIWRNTSTLTFYYSSDGSSITQLPSNTWSASNGVWYHIAACRNGADMRLFIDGTQFSTTHNIGATSLANVSQTMRIGNWSNALGTLGVDGWMASVRITKGVARYTANFTPPTLPLPTS